MKEIAEAIRNTRCVLFAGAGISRDAGLPDWMTLGNELYKRLNKKGKVPTEYQDAINTQLKNKKTILEGIGWLIDVVKRRDVTEELRDLLKPKQESAVCNELKRLKMRGFITTNYDRLLDNMLSSTQYRRLTNSLLDLKKVTFAIGDVSTPFLLKLHGDIDDELSPDDVEVAKGGPFLVLCKTDYTALIQGDRGEALRLALHAVLQNASILFLGYGFSDPDIRLALEFLSKYCNFHHQSWFVGLEGEQQPQLPSNISVIQPFKDWKELPLWLNEICKKVSIAVSISGEPQIRKLSPEEKDSIRALAEYVISLESEDLCSKTVACVLANALVGRSEIQQQWVNEFVSTFFDIGPNWAEAFAKAAIRQLQELKLIEELPEGRSFRVVKTLANRLHDRINFEWSNDRNQFFESIKQRMAYAGVYLDTKFINLLDDAVQHLCMRYAQPMAEYIHRGIQREIGHKHVREVIEVYFDNPNKVRMVTELFQLIFDDPTDEEIPYLYRLISATFLLNSVKLDPSASKFLKDSISQYELYLDTNVLLPLLICEHSNHSWMSLVIKKSKESGAQLFVLRNFLGEISHHRKVAEDIYENYEGNIDDLSLYVQPLGQRANCFITGYLNKIKGISTCSWREYMQNYDDSKLMDLLAQAGIKLVPSNVERDSTYQSVLQQITTEWSSRMLGARRHPTLNENEALQFLKIYQRRGELSTAGKDDTVWFLSYETVLARVYQTNPQRWGMPPTFPFSAWVCFLDSRLVEESRNRHHILRAILKGHSTAYELPEPIALVRKKAFGDRILAEEEDWAINMVKTGQVYPQLERLRNRIAQGSAPRSSLREFKETQESVVAQVEEELAEKIQDLERELKKEKEASSEEKARLKREIENLKILIKQRKKQKKPKKQK